MQGISCPEIHSLFSCLLFLPVTVLENSPCLTDDKTLCVKCFLILNRSLRGYLMDLWPCALLCCHLFSSPKNGQGVQGVQLPCTAVSR